MSISDSIRRLMEIGAPQEAILAVIEAYEKGIETGKASAPAVDPVAEKRRAYDRERKAKKRETSGGIPVEVPQENPPESPADKASASSPLDGPLSPSHTLPLSPLNPPTITIDNGGASADVLPFPQTKNRKAKAERATTLPANFTLTPERLAFALKEGHTDASARREFSKFTGSAEAHGRRYVNWDRAWENWVRTSIDGFGRSRGPAPSGHGSPSGGRFGAMQRALAKVTDPYDVSQ